MIYFTSDLHLYHDKEFIYRPRGFETVDDMSNTVINNINEVVLENDTLYILGDLILNKSKEAESIQLLNSIKCKNIYVIVGNHDTDSRVDIYKTIPNIKEVVDAKRIKYGKYHFFLCHYPTFTGNLEKESLSQILINLYGHTHQKTNFYNEIPFMYHVGIDSHDNKPVDIDTILRDIKYKAMECMELL